MCLNSSMQLGNVFLKAFKRKKIDIFGDKDRGRSVYAKDEEKDLII